MKIAANAKIIYAMLAPKYKVIARVFLALIISGVGFALMGAGLAVSGFQPSARMDLFSGVGLMWTIAWSGLLLCFHSATIISLSLSRHLQHQYRIAAKERLNRIVANYKKGA